MSSSISTDDFKDLVRSRTDIVQLIGEYVSLQPQRGGRVFLGLCPFHDDHRPSFNVNAERQSYRCWSCQEGGDCFSFVMKKEMLGFREALEHLARRANLELPQSMRGPGISTTEKQVWYEVLAWAEREFHDCLRQSPHAGPARDYLQRRGFSAETIQRCKLGYAPGGWDWLVKRATQRGFALDSLEQTRLVKARDPGASGSGSGYYDFFVDRVMFPIHDERGRPVAFGGRVLGDGTPKYLNSSESPVFHKSRLCYGLDFARDGIKRADHVLVVEGYTDCIKCHQAGLWNVVGALGVALTESHLQLLRRFTRKVVLVFDGDEAGQRAAQLALGKFLPLDIDLRVLTLPDQLDPDEYIDAHGVEALRDLIAVAPEAWDYQLRFLANRFGLESTDSKQQVIESMLGLLQGAEAMQGTVKESLLLSRLAQRLGCPEFDLRQRLQQLRAGKAGASKFRRPASMGAVDNLPVDLTAGAASDTDWKAAIETLQQKPRKDDLLECELLAILLTAPHMIDVVRQEVGVEDFQQPALKALLTVFFDLAEQGEHPSYDQVLGSLDDAGLKSLVVWLDDQAQARRLDELLNQDRLAADARPEGAEPPESLLRQVLNGLKWRREHARYAVVNDQSRLRVDAGLSPEAKAQLQRAAQFHQQRVTRQT